jgi:hypothetical protein
VRNEEFETMPRQVGKTGRIADHLDLIATAPGLVDQSIDACMARIEEARPRLLDVLRRAAAGEALSDADAQLLFVGIHILGGARQEQAFQPLLRFLRRPIDYVEDLVGDCASVSLAKILAGTFDGDADAVFEAIADRSIDEFGRHACLGAATFLTWDGRIGHDRMHAFLQRFYEERLVADCNFAWIAWLEAIALLGCRDLAPLVHQAWDEERIPELVLERARFEELLSNAERAPGDVARLKDFNLGYIDDVVETLETYADLEDELYEPPEPAKNPWRGVGRNDPCPCGSGKKFKKCCMPA